MGQYYCLHCDRYFANVTVRMITSDQTSQEAFVNANAGQIPKWSIVKQMMGPAPHTQLDAELAAGMGARIMVLSLCPCEHPVFGFFADTLV
ncbi:hypothetical protein NC651_014703 [Populus alba x Populus x berolinensis]|nr:hypothetical protein NC651_014703 [Populus alba x Populus x berolinensis]